MIESLPYELFFAFLTAVCLAQFYWAFSELPRAWEAEAKWWVCWVIVTNVFFLVDLCLHVTVYGFIWVMKKKIEYA